MNFIWEKSSIIFKSVFIYFILLWLVASIFDMKILYNSEVVINRVVFVVIFAISYLLKPKLSYKTWGLLTVVLCYAALSGLYKETAIFNHIFAPNIDNSLISIDQLIWGYQPSIVFSESLSSGWFSELMFFGYFSYYLMPIVVIAIIYLKKSARLEEFGFVLITSFLIYYLIFIILPAFGPQFYLEAPINYIEAKGVFGQIIKIIQENGEAKTAAFPSSHVGISLIVLIWLWKNFSKSVVYFIPTTILLILATVYIKAHYSVDVFAGFVSAPVIYLVSTNIYKRFKKNTKKWVLVSRK